MPFENRDESLLTIVSKYGATCNGIYAVGRQILRVASVQRSVKRSPKQRVCRSYGRARASQLLWGTGPAQRGEARHLEQIAFDSLPSL